MRRARRRPGARSGPGAPRAAPRPSTATSDITLGGHSRMQMPQPMHSPTWSGRSIIHASGRPGPGAGLDARGLRPAHVQCLDRAHVHADAARDAAALVDVDAVAHQPPPCGVTSIRSAARIRPRPVGQGGRPPDRVGPRGPFGPGRSDRATTAASARRSARRRRGPRGRPWRRPRRGSARGACRGCCAGGT